MDLAGALNTGQRLRLVCPVMGICDFKRVNSQSIFYVCWDLVPLFRHSDCEEVSPQFQPPVLHANVQRVGGGLRGPGRLAGHVEPLCWVHLFLACQDLLDHGHVGLVAPLLQCC